MNAYELKDYPKSETENFKAIFGVELTSFIVLPIACYGIYSFDIVRFDDWFKKRYGDYEDGKTSLKNIVLKKLGRNALKILEKVM